MIKGIRPFFGRERFRFLRDTESGSSRLAFPLSLLLRCLDHLPRFHGAQKLRTSENAG